MEKGTPCNEISKEVKERNDMIKRFTGGGKIIAAVDNNPISHTDEMLIAFLSSIGLKIKKKEDK